MIGIRLVRNIAVMQWRAPGTRVLMASASASPTSVISSVEPAM